MNAFKAGYRAAGGDPEKLEELLETENIWIHDPRYEEGMEKKELKNRLVTDKSRKRLRCRGRWKSIGTRMERCSLMGLVEKVER